MCLCVCVCGCRHRREPQHLQLDHRPFKNDLISSLFFFGTWLLYAWSGQQSRVHYIRFVIDNTPDWFYYYYLAGVQTAATAQIFYWFRFVSFRRLCHGFNSIASFCIHSTFFPHLFLLLFRVVLLIVPVYMTWARFHDRSKGTSRIDAKTNEQIFFHFLFFAFFCISQIHNINFGSLCTQKWHSRYTKTHTKAGKQKKITTERRRNTLCNNISTQTVHSIIQNNGYNDEYIQNRERLTDSRWGDSTGQNTFATVAAAKITKFR